MGSGSSHPVAADAPATRATLIIRNLAITALELKLAERLDPPHHLHTPAALAKVSSRISEEQRPSSPSQGVKGVTISPFSEHVTTIDPPDPTRHEQLRLTFEDPATGHRYSAEIPGRSHRSIVLRPISASPSDETNEFTAIYLPAHNYLALFSSVNLSSWMSTLDPSLPLTALSIPGTHNSPTHHVALPSVRCQSVPVPTQLANGVRFLDVRVSCPRFTPHFPELALVHSAFPVSLTGTHHLSTLLRTLYTFLTHHPSETILLSLKREGTGLGTDADLHRILTTHYIRAAPPTGADTADPTNNNNNNNKWYTLPHIPTLGQARGRIVLLRRFHLHPSTGAGAGALGIDASVWPDNVPDGLCGSGLVRIQDWYGVGKAADIARKQRFALEGLERAAERVHLPGDDGDRLLLLRPPPLPLFINFLSASSLFSTSCWPDKIAVKINPSMVEYLCMGHGAHGKGPGQLAVGDAATGIVVTDWVGHHGDWDLVRCIVGWNARLQLRQ
ncbi:PLC-like phosphodiesterase [Trichocladium antarcticum]|uniref:PLC-like phosphodiesterase n=1 Tax=Trichocladium antarcticum TaxID=1450529 RepID=A0AAN6ZGI7_9PEZI|nr:PLC-like phosphodiesterase [Trichocladium antarcticum]